MSSAPNASAAVDRRHRLREILAGPRCLVPAPIFDPLSARMAEDIGYRLALLPGSLASASILGAPDLILLGLTELSERVRRIVEACDLPLIVDGDHGYGAALNTYRAVREIENAGAAAITIEDTWLPRPWNATNGPAPLISVAEMMGKLHAAVAARQDPAFVIIARTSAEAGGVEAGRRLAAYSQAGVDALFVSNIATSQAFGEVCASIDLPLAVATTVEGAVNRQAAEAGGARLYVQDARRVLHAALQGVHAELATLHQEPPTGRAVAASEAAWLSDRLRQSEWQALARL
jgi:oxaloacetate decarboxylase